MYLENTAEVIWFSTVIIVVAIIIFGVHVTYLAIAIRSDIMKRLNEINTKIDRLTNDVKIRCGTFLD